MKKDLRSKVQKQVEAEGYDKDKVQEAKSIYDKYAGKDEKELKSKLLEMATKGKADGSLSDESIEQMAKKIAPMLDKQKQQKLNSIISMLKKQ